MLIQIVRSDNHYDYVKDFILDSLIKAKTIVKFKRNSGWVTIGSDPIRGSNSNRLLYDTDR